MSKKSVKLYTDNVIEEFYNAVINNNLNKLHIPHSDVFYVRSCSGSPLWQVLYFKEVEDAMIAEGWSESKDLQEEE